MIRFRKGFILTVILLAGISLTFMPSIGSATMYDMTATNANLGLTPGTVFATVELTIDFSVPTLPVANFDVVVNQSVLSGGVIDKFFFNTDLTLTAGQFTSLPPDWALKAFNSQGDSFGNFTIELKGNKNPLASLAFSVANPFITGENNFTLLSNNGTGDALFAAHIRGFDINGETSAYFATVPEPGTLLLLGSGLTALGLWRRKKFNSKS